MRRITTVQRDLDKARIRHTKLHGQRWRDNERKIAELEAELLTEQARALARADGFIVIGDAPMLLGPYKRAIAAKAAEMEVAK